MKYTVKKYNDFFFDVFVGEFNVMRLDIENELLDIDIPADKPLNVSARNVHKAAKNIMSKLTGEWYLGDLRITDEFGNYNRTALNVTRIDTVDSSFSAKHVLTAKNGEISISDLS